MANLAGTWKVTVHTFMGDQLGTHILEVNGDSLSGKIVDGANGNSTEIVNPKLDGNKFDYDFTLKVAIGVQTFHIAGEMVDDNTIKGVSSNAMGEFQFDGVRA